MNPRFVSLQRQQLDAVLDNWRAARLPTPPGSGWIKAIREALGMPASFLARRLGVVPSSVLRMEDSEADDSITLATLKRAAHALGCDVQYALVPRMALREIVEHRAHSVAQAQVADVAHTMALEAQNTSAKARNVLVQELEAELTRGAKRGLWK
ncbi:MAG: mobile mystery protein A [Spirochaetales bacterium]